MLAAFVDIETTGLDPFQHRVLEIAITVVDLQSGTPVDSFEAIVQQPESVWEAADPESLKVNGFSPEKTEGGISEAEAAEKVEAFLVDNGIKRGRSVFIAQNSSFDRAFLAQLVPTYRQEDLHWPYHWLDFASMYWSASQLANGKLMTPENSPPLSKNAIARELAIPPEPTPHRARNGVSHLIACYTTLIKEGVPADE